MTKEELIALKKKVLELKKIDDINKLLPNMNCYDFLYQCNKERLDDIAINYLGNKITFNDLFKMSNNTAKAFTKLGVKKGDFVSVSLLATPEGIATFYALRRIGAKAHMVNPASSKSEIINYMNKVNSKIYVTMDLFNTKKMNDIISETNTQKIISASLTDSLPEGINLDNAKYKIITNIKKATNNIKNDDKHISWKEFYASGLSENIEIESVYEENSGSCIAYTSGSTGVSKAVLATDKAINSMPVQLGMSEKKFAPNDVIFNTLPLWIYYSLINNIHNPLCLGVTVALDPIFNAKKIHKRLKQYRFNHWNTIPAYVEDMCNDRKVSKLNLSNLKSITTGGDYLTNNLKEKADNLLEKCGATIKVGQGYGASEVLGSFAYTYEENATIGSVGKPLIGNKMKIVDIETNSVLGTNQTGELYLYSPTIMKEYYGNEEATKEVLIKDEEGIVWYRTGDLAHISDKNELFIDGRIRRIVLTKDEQGFPTKIIPDKIKKELLANKNVEKCEIITVKDNKVVNKPVAFVQLKEECDENKLKEELIAYCIERVPSYMVPTEIKFVDSIPLTTGLKPDWNKMEEMYQNNNKTKIKLKRKRV